MHPDARLIPAVLALEAVDAAGTDATPKSRMLPNIEQCGRSTHNDFHVPILLMQANNLAQFPRSPIKVFCIGPTVPFVTHFDAQPLSPPYGRVITSR